MINEQSCLRYRSRYGGRGKCHQAEIRGMWSLPLYMVYVFCVFVPSILAAVPLLKVLLYFNQWFSSCFFALAICTYAYKAWRYYYPSGALGLEISLTFLYGAVEMMRLFLASKGNKAEQINPLVMSLGLAVPVTLLYAFSLALQTYVLRLDVIVAIIGLVFVGFEGLLSVGTAVSFYHAFRG